MIKKITLVFCILFLPSVLFGQVKNYICKVQEFYSEGVTKQLKDLAKYFQQSGEQAYSSRIEEFLEAENYGTGFVYVRPDGKNFVITNRHLVEYGESVKVTFYNEDKSVNEYSDLEVVSLSDTLDLAVLAFPNDIRPFEKGLEFYPDEIPNGAKVVAAGFVDGKNGSVWKMTGGVISNNNAKIKELANPEIATFVQHTAKLEAGNSGGPLLLEKDKKYYVAGVNFWSAINREKSNVAISLENLMDYLENGTDEIEPENPGEEVYERAIKFGTFLGSWETKFQDIMPHISSKYIGEFGKQIFVETQRKCPAADWVIISDSFMYGNPLDGLKCAIAWNVFEIYHRNDRKFEKQKKSEEPRAKKIIPVSIQPPDCYKDTEDWYVIYNLPAKRLHAFSRWIFEQGKWQLRNFLFGSGEFAVKDKDLSHMGKVKLYQPNTFTITNGISGNILSYDNTTFIQYLDAEIKIKNWLSVDTTGKLVSYEVPVMRVGKSIFLSKFKQAEFQAGVQFQMPFFLNSIILMPYASTKVGVQLEDNYPKMTADLTLDADGAFRAVLFLKDFGLSFYADTGCSFVVDSIVHPNAEGNRFTTSFDFFGGLGFGIKL